MRTSSNYALRLPTSLKRAVEEVAREDGTTLNQFIVSAVAEKLAALKTADYFAKRAARADFAVFDRLMRRRGGEAPRPDVHCNQRERATSAHVTMGCAAFCETCRYLNVPAALERSRSGEGAHVWIFFDGAIPATLARKLGSHILTETMERRPEIGLKSYDRFFPNQDTLPVGGFGNLIALPLQRRPRELGNSVFLDENLVPYTDQWAFLSSIRRIDRSATERIAREAEAADRVVGVRHALAAEDEPAPWTLPPSRRRKEPPLSGPLPASLQLTINDEIYIAKDVLPPALRNRLLRLAAFQNPEFYQSASDAPAYVR